GFAHSLRLRLPGSPQADAGFDRVFAGGGEQPYSMPGADVLCAPLVVEYGGSTSDWPRLVEVEDLSTGSSLQMMPEPPGSARFVSPPIASGPYLVVAWRPDSGTFRGRVEHDPSSSKVHPLKVPETGHLILQVELPEEVRRDGVEVSTPAYRFERFGLGTSQTTWTRR